MKVQISLGLNGSSNLEVMADAEHYSTSIKDNSLFQISEITGQVTKVETANNNLHTEIVAAISENKTDKVKDAREKLERELTKLKGLIEGVANDPATPESQRLSVVHSAGMTEKSQKARQARVFKVVNGDVSGTVILMARGGASANEWQYTTDTEKFTNRVAADTTTTASTEIAGLPVKTDVAFFHKAIISGVKTDWEGPIIITVL